MRPAFPDKCKIHPLDVQLVGGIRCPDRRSYRHRSLLSIQLKKKLRTTLTQGRLCTYQLLRWENWIHQGNIRCWQIRRHGQDGNARLCWCIWNICVGRTRWRVDQAIYIWKKLVRINGSRFQLPIYYLRHRAFVRAPTSWQGAIRCEQHSCKTNVSNIWGKSYLRPRRLTMNRVLPLFSLSRLYRQVWTEGRCSRPPYSPLVHLPSVDMTSKVGCFSPQSYRYQLHILDFQWPTSFLARHHRQQEYSQVYRQDVSSRTRVSVIRMTWMSKDMDSSEGRTVSIELVRDRGWRIDAKRVPSRWLLSLR